MNNGWKTMTAIIGIGSLSLAIFFASLNEKASKDSVTAMSLSVRENSQRIQENSKCIHDLALEEAKSMGELKRMILLVHSDLRVMAARQNIVLEPVQEEPKNNMDK